MQPALLTNPRHFHRTQMKLTPTEQCLMFLCHPPTPGSTGRLCVSAEFVKKHWTPVHTIEESRAAHWSWGQHLGALCLQPPQTPVGTQRHHSRAFELGRIIMGDSRGKSAISGFVTVLFKRTNETISLQEMFLSRDVTRSGHGCCRTCTSPFQADRWGMWV